MTKSDLQLYSAGDVENARTKGQLVGWIQGAGAMLLLGLVLSIVGWIPTLAVGALVVVLLVKLLRK
jgi:hypothetical protein